MQETATFANPGVTTGTGNFTLTATDAADNFTATGASELHYTGNLALNAYQTPFPAPSATSSQSAYPPYLAVDGSTSTYWTSGGLSPTPSTPIDFEENFGALVTIGSVTMTPRPGYGPDNYTIQASTDGQNWTTIATVTPPSATSPVTTTVTPTTAQYLKLVMTGTFQGSGSTDQIAELAVTGP